MSLFGGLMGDLDDDPFFGGHMRRMNNMMSSMMSDMFGAPFGGMLGGGGVPRGGEMVAYDQGRHHAAHRRPPPPHPEDYMANPMANALMPMGFGFPMIRGMFDNIGNPAQNCHSYSSSTVMTMTSGPDGRPQVYQASSSMRQAPGGIKETKKTVADSRTGVKKMSIGHHIGERAHILEREQNVYAGTAEEHQEFINLEEEEADTFNREWERKARGNQNAAIGYHGGSMRHHHHQQPQQRGRNNPQLALPPPPSSSSGRQGQRSRRLPAITSSSHHAKHYPTTSSSSGSGSRSGSESRGSAAAAEGGGSGGKKRKQEEEDEDSGDEHERDLRDERPQPKRRSNPPNPQPTIVLDVSDSDEN